MVPWVFLLLSVGMAAALPVNQNSVYGVKCGQDDSTMREYTLAGMVDTKKGQVDHENWSCSSRIEIDPGLEYYCTGGSYGNSVTCRREGGAFICGSVGEADEVLYHDCKIYVRELN